MKLLSSQFVINQTNGTAVYPLPQIEMELSNNGQTLMVSAQGFPEIAGDVTVDLEVLNGTLANSVLTISEVITLRVTDAGRAKFANAVGGLRLGVEANLREVLLVLRPKNADGIWTIDAPFLTIELCWDLITTTDSIIKGASGSTLAVGATAEFPVCTKLAIVSPPQKFLGIPDLFALIDIEPFTIDTGWIPLDIVEDWTDFFDMRGLAKWLLGLWNVDLSGYNLEFPDWEIDFPTLPRLPYNARFLEEEFSLTKSGDVWQIYCRLKGLEVAIADFEIADPNFELEVVFESGKYKISAGIAQLQFPHPDRPTEIEPRGIGLPFDLLKAEARCWLLRFGLHFLGGAGANSRVCVDTILEIGGFTIGTEMSQDPLWSGDIRLHLRDLTVMTAAYGAAAPKFFEKANSVPLAGGGNFFAEFQHPLPEMSFAEKLPRQVVDPVNEGGLSLLAADFRGKERIYVAWEQKGNQLFKALTHDLLGTEAAGAVPADAEVLQVGMEISIDDTPYATATQVRVDWARKKPAPRPTPPVIGSPTTTTGNDNCIPATDALSGVHLPFGGNGVNLDNLTIPQPMVMQFPGIRLEVARPSAHSLVFREEGDESQTVSYMLIWDAQKAPKVPIALATAKIGFSLSDGEDGSARQVAETEAENADSPFLTVALGQDKDTGQAIRVLGVKRQDGKLQSPKFLKVYAPEGGNTLPSLIPDPPPQSGVDDCPIPLVPLPPFLPLSFDDFSSPDLFDTASPWRLSLKLGASQALLNLFGEQEKKAADEEDKALVDFTIEKFCLIDDGSLDIHTALEIELVDGFKLGGTVVFGFDIDNMSLFVRDGAGLSLVYPTEPDNATPAWAKTVGLMGNLSDYNYVDKTPDLFGLKLKAIRKKDVENGEPISVSEMTFLQANMRDGKFTLSVPEDTELLLRLEDVGDDGLSFRVREFVLGPGGLDCVAEMLPTTFKVPGLKKPFSLDFAQLVVQGSVLQTVHVKGSGQMPELFNSAPVTMGFSIKQDPNTRRIRLRDFTCELGGKGPILSKGVRLKFDLEKVKLQYEDREGSYPATVLFNVTGKVTFTPEGGELGGTILETFKDMTLEFTDAPVGDEFFDHIELMVTLNEPVERELFSIFRMQLRSVGFHPNYEFGPNNDCPALIFGGQVEFADIGDVASVEIDFHKLYLGFPKESESLPQVDAMGLRVEISTGGFKIGGRVDEFDEDLITGFKGEGVVQIPGLPELSAAFAFTRIRKNVTDSWKRAWFISIDAGGISYQIAPLPLYLRQIGLGFGYRYTSPLIRTFESEDDLGTLIQKMLEAIRTHQTLARPESWVEDLEDEGRPSRWTIGFETVFSMASANSDPLTYRQGPEQKLKSAVAQILAFLRSDLTFLAAAKVWFPVSFDDFLEDKKGMRKRPLASGFMGYSAPKNRLLIHAASGKNPYLGPDNDPVPKQLKPVFDKVHFEATFLSEPGLVHAELGWPDRLLFPLDFGALKLECRGGVLFRLERDVLIQGIYFSATSQLSFSGGVKAGCVGVCVTASARFSAAVRLMAALYLSRPLQSQIYAALGVDISVSFSLRAWLHIKTTFFTLKITIKFSFELQIVVALELGWAGGANFGFKAQARVSIGVFGRSLSVRVSASLFGSNVDQAQRALMPYMSSFLEPGAIPPMPGIENQPQPGAVPLDVQPTTALQSLENSAPPAKVTENAFSRLAALRSNQPIIEPSTVPSVPTEENIAHPRLFNIALAEGSSRRRWYGWIMPNVIEGGFYPVPLDPGGQQAVPYATLTLPNLDPETTVYTLDDQGKWKNEGTSKRTLYFRTGPRIEAIEDGTDTQSQSRSMDLRDFLACSHFPLDSNNDQFLPFGFGDAGFEIVCPIPHLFGKEDSVTDTRLNDLASDVRNPKRRLDPENRYDRLVLAAMEQTPDDSFWTGKATKPEDRARMGAMADQALGNQSFLLTSMLEDLKAIAEADNVDEGLKPEGLSEDRPTILDLGLLVCVEAEECPDWLCTRPGNTVNEVAGSRPTLSFMKDNDDAEQVKTFHEALRPDDGLPLQYEAPGELWPAIDFVDADFEVNSPVFREVVSFLDDDTLNVGWNFAWKGAAPAADLPGNELSDPEDLLDHYDIAVFVSGESEPVKRTKALPGDLVSTDNDGQTWRVKARYQFNVVLDDIPRLREITVSRQASVFVNVTPVSQTGKVGDTKVIEVLHRASIAPLPADDAKLDLSFNANGLLDGNLSWRVLSPPTAPGVVPASRWELIIRPILELPLGSYPADAVEAGESGLMNLGSDKLRDGDIVIVLDLKSNSDDFVRRKPNNEVNEARDPALEILELKLDQIRNSAEEIKNLGKLYDHRGSPISEKDESNAASTTALEFFSKRDSSERNGRGWRLFLRAHADPNPIEKETPLPEHGYSGLMPVRLRMVERKGLEGEVIPEESKTPTRLLDHLEWVRKVSEPTMVATQALQADHGPILRPSFPGGYKGEFEDVPISWEKLGNVSQVQYEPGVDKERGVTIKWQGLFGDRPYTATSGFELFEARLDHLLAQDIKPEGDDPHPDFQADLRKVKSISPIDRELMGQAVTAFTKPETWWSRTVADTAQIAWQKKRKDLIIKHALIGKSEVEPHPTDDELSRHWWSATESELEWPNVGTDQESVLRELAAKQQSAPIEILRSLRGEGLTPLDQANYLAACRDLGEFICGRSLHAYLLILVGELAARGAPQRQSGIEQSNTVPRYEVDAQVSVAGDTPPRGSSPLEWLQSIPPATDPLGWRILSEFGLSTTVSLRDGISRTTLSQEILRKEIEEALKSIKDRLNKAKSGDVTFVSIAEMADKHFGVEMPVHSNFTKTARPLDRKVDEGSLSMVQMLLRPQAKSPPNDRETVYEVIAVLEDENYKIDSRQIRFDSEMEILLPDQDRKRIKFSPDDVIDITKLVSPGEVILARYRLPGNGSRKVLFDLLDLEIDGNRQRWLSSRVFLPNAFTTPKEPPVYSPFGQFEPDHKLASLPPQQEDEDLDYGKLLAEDWTFQSLVGYFNRLLRPEKVNGDDQLGKRFDKELVKSLQDESSIKQLMALTERFFVSSVAVDHDLWHLDPESRIPRPIQIPTVSDSPYHPLRVTLTAPEDQDPYRVSPDRQGWFSYTHLVKEDWASLRGYSVRALPRTWELNPASTEESKPVLSAKSGRIDVKFDRIRKVEAAKPLGVRLTGTHEFQMHEIVLSEPIERSLSRAGLPFARKLEYLDFRYSPHYRFKFKNWHLHLLKQGLAGDLSQHRLEKIGDSPDKKSKLPKPGENDTTLLSIVPAARFGSTIIKFAAEPFYYEQSIDVLVRAGTRQSATTNIALSPPKAVKIEPFEPGGNHEPPVTVNKTVIKEWGEIDDLPPLLAGMKSRWLSAKMIVSDLSNDEKKAITAVARPIGYGYRIRQPQLSESLAPTAREGHFAAEIMTQAVGLLPDPGVYVELVEQSAGARKSVATIKPSMKSKQCFKMVQSSSTHVLSDLSVTQAGQGWTSGIMLSSEVVSEPGAVAVDLSGLEPAVFNMPNILVKSTEYDPPDQALQLAGSLSQWIPLFTRLNATGSGGDFLGPMLEPRWSIYPLASLQDNTPPSAEDVTDALRVILNRHHRMAVNLASIDVVRSQPHPLLEMTRLSEIYNAELVVVSPETNAVVDNIMDLRNPHFDSYKLFVHKPNMRVDPNENWIEIRSEKSAGEIAAIEPIRRARNPVTGEVYIFQPLSDRIVVVVPKLSGVTDEAMEELLKTLELLQTTYPGTYPFDSTTGTLEENFASLAKLREQIASVAQSIISARPPEDLSVFAHQGNSDPVEWKTEP